MFQLCFHTFYFNYRTKTNYGFFQKSQKIKLKTTSKKTEVKSPSPTTQESNKQTQISQTQTSHTQNSETHLTIYKISSPPNNSPAYEHKPKTNLIKAISTFPTQVPTEYCANLLKSLDIKQIKPPIVHLIDDDYPSSKFLCLLCDLYFKTNASLESHKKRSSINKRLIQQQLNTVLVN